MHEEPELFEDAHDRGTFSLAMHQISKIEGHAGLDVKVEKGKVTDLKLRITEGKRFYTQGVRGLSCLAMPSVVSRICGTCSIAHLTCSTLAVENALGVVPSEQTVLLRELAQFGLNLRDHALHLYFFSMPDVFAKDSILAFDGELLKYVEQAFRVKAAGNKLSTISAGKAVHPMYISVGTPKALPQKQQCDDAVKELKAVREDVLGLIAVFHEAGQRIDMTTQTRFVSLHNDKGYGYFGDKLMSSDGDSIPKQDYFVHLQRVILPYSEATGFVLEGGEYMVGALARMNLNRGQLHPQTQKDAAESLKVFPSSNVFHNNLAQAIEMLHCIDRSVEILETHEFKPEAPVDVTVKEGRGIAVTEAPRGTLYYLVDLNKEGKLNSATLVIPTAQNQVKISSDIRGFIERSLAANPETDRHSLVHGIERLIRAYDPCMSCATHFLKVRWR